MDEVGGEVALRGGVTGSVWRERLSPPPPAHPHSQTAVCLAQLELSSDHRTTLHYIPMVEVSVSCTSRLFRSSKLRGSDWAVGGSGA